jgi:MFS family permease
LGYSKTTGLLCASVFFGCFGFGRLVGIPVSARIRQRTILIFNYILAILGLVCLLFVHTHQFVLWIGIVLSALGFSTVFATQVLWFSEHIVFDGTAAGVVHTGASVGVMTGPALTGILIQALGHQWLVYLMLIMCTLGIQIYAFMLLLVYLRKRRQRLIQSKETECVKKLNLLDSNCGV